MKFSKRRAIVFSSTTSLFAIAAGFALLPATTPAQAATAYCVDSTTNQPVPPLSAGPDNRVICGEGAVAKGDGAVAVGNQAKAESNGAIALGQRAVSGSTDGTYANGAQDVPVNTIAIGVDAQSSASSGIAIGTGAKVYQGWNFNSANVPVANNYGIAIGTSATAINNNIVMGNVGAGNLLAAGSNTGPSNINNVTLGNGAGANMTGNENLIFGYQAGVGMNSFGGNVVMGRGAATNALMADSIAIGSGAGSGTAAKVTGSVAIGNGAAANLRPSAGTGVTVTCSFWTYYCQGATGDGSNNTAVGANAGQVAGALNVSMGYNANVGLVGMNNIGIGSGVAQNAVGRANVWLGTQSALGTKGDTNTAVGNFSGSSVTGNNNSALGNGSGGAVTGSSNTALGNGAGGAVTGNSNTAIGAGSGGTVTGANNFAGAYNAGRFVTGEDNVALGRGAGQGASGSPLLINRTVAVGQGSRAYSDDSIAVGASAIAGTSQSKLNAIAIGKGAQALGTNSISIGTGNVVLADGAAAIGDPNFIGATATGTYILGNNNGTSAAPIDTPDSFLIGSNILQGQTLASSVNLGSRSAAIAGATATTAGMTTYSGMTIGTEEYTFAGGTPVGVVTVGNVGTERRIQNVAAGLISATSTDAINGSQLYALLGAGGGGGGGGWNLQDNGTLPSAPIPVDGIVNVVNGTNTTATVTPKPDGAQLRVDVVDSPNFAGTVTANGLTINPGSTINMGGNKIENVAPGTNPTDAVNLSQLPIQYNNAGGTVTPGTPSNEVTMVGIGGPVIIHNVAPGKAPTDAVNVSQLPGYWSPTSSNMFVFNNPAAPGPIKITNVAPGILSPTSTDGVNGSQLYATNQQVNNLNIFAGDIQNQVNANRKEANAGIASAMALGLIRYDDRPGKFSAGVAVAGYGGEAGFSVGAGYTSESRLWRFSAGVTGTLTTGQPKFGGGASATYTFN